MMLNEREAQYVNTVMKWDQRRIRIGWFFMLLLVAGGLVVVLTIILTLQRLNDQTALWVTLPGFATGLFLIAFSIGGISWIKKRHLIASILRKLQQPSQ